MRLTRNTIPTVFFLILCMNCYQSFGQLGIPITINKPKEYEERVLRSEKSDQKKFNVPRRFIQNTVTHYNYVFNANNKLNDILERAKLAWKDDYSQLLPFYNYSLDVTARDSIQLDSVIYKSSTGIALHDLRSDWADNLYLLWGQSYYLQKKFDSAYLMFQFINYAFAPKEKDGYYKTIGSKQDGNSAFTISTKEKNSIPRRIFSEPPSRNDAFIWQIRNFLVQDQFPEASSLIVVLKSDPQFPSRLQNDLHEVQALYFYKQNMWDSAAFHLENALSNATNKQEKARWEYLVAQLYEKAGNYKEAGKYYARVSVHTTDLVMDIYAKLASVRVNRDGTDKTIERNVAELMKMAKRDRYEEYRDIIYYMAAQMELEANNTDGALAMLLKSTQYPGTDLQQRNKAFLQLADLSFLKKMFRQAYNFYDSINVTDPSITNPDAIDRRKTAAGLLADNMEIIARQDSLQRIAGLPESDRKEYVHKLVRQLRKASGLKDEAINAVNPINLPNTANPPPTDLFGTTKGEWYFYNSTLRTQGQNDFKARWGNRPNVDNWRRSAVIAKGSVVQTGNQPAGTDNGSGSTGGSADITFDNLYDRLPLTPEKLALSNDSIKNALFILGKGYIQEIEDCSAGTETLEKLRSQFSDFQPMDEVLFNLYYCYHKNGETTKADGIRQLMNKQYSGSNFTAIVTTGKNPKAVVNPEATKIYESIYDLFIEGNFTEALARKKEADQTFGKNYWTPQLLYIQAVYHIKQREDSAAIDVLNTIIAQFPASPLAEKALNMINVVKRRKQIEDELTNLQITRHEDSVTTTPVAPVTQAPAPGKDTTSTVKTNPVPPVVKNPAPPLTDTTTKQAPKGSTPYTFQPNAPYFVVLVLNKVDPVFSNEAKNAFFRYNRDTYYNKIFTMDLLELNADYRLLLTSPFATAQEAVDYVDKAKPKTATEIIPWLKGGKYNFIIISQSNLDLLKTNKDVDTYKAFLDQHFPGKF